MVIRAGKLRNKIVIQQNTPSTDSFGERDASWSTFATVWADIKPLTSREYWDAVQVNAESTLKFVIRYLSGVTPKMRISWDSRIFNIESIINVDERNKMIVLLAVENI